VSETRAVLLDVFDTVVRVDFDAAFDALVEASGLHREHWLAGLDAHRHGIMTGAISPTDAFTAIFHRAQTSPRDVSALVRRDLELLCEHATVYPDVLPCLAELRRRGIAVAFVSNCAPNAGPLLKELGLAAEVDEVILSCDIGSAKPNAGIYRKALAALAVDPADAMFVDDQAAYCSGAEALGIKAVLLDRRGVVPGSVHSLEDVLPIL
jgi:putative hydrolase of the HAD superfamily